MTTSGKIDWTWSPLGVCGKRMFDVDVTVHYEVCDYPASPFVSVDRIVIGDGKHADEPDGELKTAMRQDLEADDALCEAIFAREGIYYTGQGGNDPDGRWKKGG
jgi:hypothetical protein